MRTPLRKLRRARVRRRFRAATNARQVPKYRLRGLARFDPKKW